MTTAPVDQTKKVACVLAIGRPHPQVSPLMLLLQRRATDSYPLAWCIPGGKVEEGENVLAAAVRELQEETGMPALTSEIDRVLTYPVPGYEFHVCLIFYAGNLPFTSRPEGNPGLGWFDVFADPPQPNITPLNWYILEHVREAVRLHYKIKG